MVGDGINVGEEKNIAWKGGQNKSIPTRHPTSRMTNPPEMKGNSREVRAGTGDGGGSGVGRG